MGRLEETMAGAKGVVRVDRSSRLDGWLESVVVVAVGELSTSIS